ncbi:MAG: hypothetical protein KGR26_10145 [Cyanobacteria bacterium REEB65]|nr:hypothetical protein [Cyanobacteria bacterium REEB65]
MHDPATTVAGLSEFPAYRIVYRSGGKIHVIKIAFTATLLNAEATALSWWPIAFQPSFAIPATSSASVGSSAPPSGGGAPPPGGGSAPPSGTGTTPPSSPMAPPPIVTPPDSSLGVPANTAFSVSASQISATDDQGLVFTDPSQVGPSLQSSNNP